MNRLSSYIRRMLINFFWILPLLIVLSICVGFIFNVNSPDKLCSSIGGQLCDITYLLKLEILPFITLLFCVYWIIRTRKTIKSYRRTLPNTTKETGILRLFISYLRLPRRIFIPSIGYWMLCFWSIGWGLYICALWSNYYSDGNIAEILGYSAMASLDLFLLDINGNILDGIGKSIDGFNSAVIKGGIIIHLCLLHSLHSLL